MANKIQLRRGNAANLPTLDAGEPAFTLDTRRLYVGDGSSNVQIASANDAVLKTAFDANTILKADSDDTPSALSVPASTIVGRGASGGIASLNADDARTVLGLATTDNVVFGRVSGVNTPVALSSAIAHMTFDGATPYNSDFTGSNLSHMGVSGTESGGVIYRPGRYGKAVQIAESTTNYCNDPSSEGASGWSAQYNGAGYLSGAQSTDYALYGSKSYKVVATQVTWDGYYNAAHYQVGGSVSWAPGESITVSCYVRGTGTWYVVGEDSYENLRGAQLVAATGQWQRVIVTCTNTFGYTYSAFYLSVFSASAGTLYIDGVQIEKKAYATPYCDGSLGQGHSWSGTAHASASSRTGGDVTYSQMLNAQAGTVALWYYSEEVLSSSTGRNPYVFGAGSAYSQLSIVYQPLRVFYNGATLVLGSLSAQQWTHIAVTWNNGEVIAFLDGVQVVSSELGSWTPGGSIFVGGWGSSGTYVCNGLIDDLMMLDYAAPPELIYQVYASNAPVLISTASSREQQRSLLGLATTDTPTFAGVATNIITPTAGLGVGVSTPTLSSGNGVDISGANLRLRTSRTPANATAAGNVGEFCWDGSYFYICVATNTWRRVAHSSW